ncbi:hypothetical protein VEZ01S_05_00400 [Vibrio ezurae NBRC 102218]|uniref:Uncharacterized protein n=1 Tax=Vibrio ezurae NBRC 102218 TaxID=1219080 RepID=U3AZL3_9VIBR|nr:hypothetical protein VEZ01S_05_00400 [Vibrio ezurae NBRC 102218]
MGLDTYSKAVSYGSGDKSKNSEQIMFTDYFKEKYQCPKCRLDISKEDKLKLMYKTSITCPFCKSNIGICKGLFRPLLPFELSFVILFYFTSNTSEINTIIALLLFALLSFTLGTKIDTLLSRLTMVNNK